jgi:hypothetical protein
MFAPPSLTRRTVSTIVGWALTCVLLAPHVQARSADAVRTWMPPAYLMWRTGGLPGGLAPRLDALRGTRAVAVVAGDTLWMRRSTRADGTVVDRAAGRHRYPIEVMAVRIHDWAAFLPASHEREVLTALRRGRGVLGASSASLRRLHVGDRIVLPDGRIVIGAIVPDEVVAWSEVMVTVDEGRALGVRHDRFALLQMEGQPTEAELARRVAPLLGAGYPPRVRRPGHAEFRRQGDAVWPPVLMKRGFGEFRAAPDPNRPGYLRMEASFARRSLTTRSVPLLGRFTCHERVFPALIAAMRELRAMGRGDAVRNFAGCYNARMVMRRPSNAISHHTWGAAVDINSLTNPYGRPPRQPAVLVRVMARQGFTWGGRWTVPDGMHFEYVGIAGLP